MSGAPSPSRVQAILDEAMSLAPDRLTGFLDAACAGDSALRREVESLLGVLSRAGGFLSPGKRPAAPSRIVEPESVLTGRTIGPFTVGDRIGAGGMGVVYKAHDTRLGRTVALKVIRESPGHDPGRRERLEREARSLASLNHPNIGAILSLEEFAPGDGAWVLVLEFVPGQTLAERLADGPLPIDEALRLARQIAEALEAAHARGIIHRDLKPGNIKITPEGAAKILDFGLAKELIPAMPRVGSTGVRAAPGTPAAPREQSVLTQEGLILGTPAYMSPEQARGRPVDRRTDLWAFGCVLYEMLVGTPAFAGETATDTIAAILRGEPDWSRLPPDIGIGVRRLLRRCLEKDADRRLRDAGDARLELDEAGTDAAPPAQPGRARWRSGAVAALMAAGVLIGAGLALWVVRRGGTGHIADRTQATRIAIDLPAGSGVKAETIGGCLALSPDGRTVAYVAGDSATDRRLFVRNLGEFEATELPGTQGAQSPCFSPDGKWIAYGDCSGAGEIKKIRTSGGAPVTIAAAPSTTAAGICWCEDDTIVLITPVRGGLSRVSASGGPMTPVIELDPTLRDEYYLQVESVPGRRAVLFTCVRIEADRFRLSIDAVEVATGRRRRVVDDACQPRCMPGFLVYYQQGALMGAAFNAQTLAIAGEPRKVLTPLAGSESIPRPRFAVSRTGTLAYLPSSTTFEATELAWYSRDGAINSVCKADGLIDSFRLSPDGTKVAYAAGTVLTDLWVRDLARGPTTRIAAGARRYYPIWTPDGRRIAYENYSTDRIEWTTADGASNPEPLVSLQPGQTFYPNAFTPDAKSLIFTMAATAGGPEDLFIVHLEGDRTPQRLFSSPAYASRFGARLSPDGTLIAYTSEESGRMEICLQPFPALDRKIPVSSGGGLRSAWSGDGNTLYYRSQDRLYAADVRTSPELAVSEPRLVLEHLPESRYDAAPDGSRFIVAQTPGGSLPPSRINIVVNWAEAELNGPSFGDPRSMIGER